MLPSLTRFSAAALLVSASAFAAPQGAQIPSFLAPMFTQMNLDAVASITYQDEKGQQIDAEKFAQLFKEKKSFGMTKKAHEDGLPEVTLRLQPNMPVENSFARLKAGASMPEFHLTRLDGTSVDNKVLEGRYSLVSFHFAACGPCVREVPLLNALAQRRKDLNLFAITFDSAKESKEFVAQHGLAWPIVVDAGKLTKEIGVTEYPTLALFNPNGKLVEVMTGSARLENPVAFDAWLDRKLAGVN